MSNEFKNFAFNIIAVSITILLNACQQFPCQTEGKVLIMRTQPKIDDLRNLSQTAPNYSIFHVSRTQVLEYLKTA